jgi:hypothetical protein
MYYRDISRCKFMGLLAIKIPRKNSRDISESHTRSTTFIE